MKTFFVTLFAVICTIAELNNVSASDITIGDDTIEEMEKFKAVDDQFTLFYLDQDVIKRLNLDKLSYYKDALEQLKKHNCLFSFVHHQYDCKGEQVHEDLFFNWCVEGNDEVTKDLSEKVEPVLREKWGNLAKRTLHLHGSEGTDQTFIAQKLCNTKDDVIN